MKKNVHPAKIYYFHFLKVILLFIVVSAVHLILDCVIYTDILWVFYSQTTDKNSACPRAQEPVSWTRFGRGSPQYFPATRHHVYAECQRQASHRNTPHFLSIRGLRKKENLNTDTQIFPIFISDSSKNKLLTIHLTCIIEIKHLTVSVKIRQLTYCNK